MPANGRRRHAVRRPALALALALGLATVIAIHTATTTSAPTAGRATAGRPSASAAPTPTPTVTTASTSSPTAPSPPPTRHGVGTPNPKDFNLVDGKLVRWDACRPIDWVLHRGPGPADARQIATQALGQVTAATGLTFHFAGNTGTLFQVGESSAPRTVTISWATPSEVPKLRGDVAGIGGSSYEWTPGEDPRPASGAVIVDATQRLDPGFVNGRSVGAVLLHELGHVLGLAHVDDPKRLMYPSTNPELSGRYQPGDLAALAAAVEPRTC